MAVLWINTKRKTFQLKHREIFVKKYFYDIYSSFVTMVFCSKNSSDQLWEKSVFDNCRKAIDREFPSFLMLFRFQQISSSVKESLKNVNIFFKVYARDHELNAF